MTDAPLMLIDAASLYYRAFHGVPDRRRDPAAPDRHRFGARPGRLVRGAR